jgi:hypothetical protein
MKPNLLLTGLAAAGLLALSGCNYDVPVTPEPTRPVDGRLLGDWIRYDRDEQKIEQLSVRKLDDSHYVVAIDGDIYRGFHTDHAKLPLVSLQDLNSGSRKFVYYAWQLSLDGAQLTLRRVAQEVIPETAKDTATIQRLLSDHATDPKLFDPELVFARKKSGQH